MATSRRAVLGRWMAPTLLLLTFLWSAHAFQIESPIATSTPRRHHNIRSASSLAVASEWMLDAQPTIEMLTTTTSTLLSSTLVSPEPIHTAFAAATFVPQPFYVLLILFPNTNITKKIMGGFQVPAMLGLLHFFIVVSSILLDNASAGGATAPLSELNSVFDPSGDSQAAFAHMVQTYPNFVAEEWSHVLTWDFFVAWWIWQDGVRRNIFTSHSVLLCNLIGPPGLLLHWITCLLTGNAILDPDNKVNAAD